MFESFMSVLKSRDVVYFVLAIHNDRRGWWGWRFIKSFTRVGVKTGINDFIFQMNFCCICCFYKQNFSNRFCNLIKISPPTNNKNLQHYTFIFMIGFSPVSETCAQIFVSRFIWYPVERLGRIIGDRRISKLRMQHEYNFAYVSGIFWILLLERAELLVFTFKLKAICWHGPSKKGNGCV